MISNLMLRRILPVIAFLAATVAIGFALWYFFFRPPAAPPSGLVVNANAPAAGGGLAPAGAGGAVVPPVNAPAGGIAPAERAAPIANGGLTVTPALAPVSVSAASLSPDGDGVRYYDRDDGKFYRIDPDTGDKVALSDKRFADVESVAWAPTEDKAVLEFPDGSNVMFNFATQRQATLPRHWEEFQFTADSEQLVSKSLGIDPSNRWLVVSNDDGSSARPVQELGNNESKVIVSVSPTSQVVALSRTGDAQGFGRQEIIPIGQNKENFKGLVVEGLNFTSKWTPDGKRMLYSAVSPNDDYRPMLWIVEAYGESIGAGRRKLNLNTWADKCAFGAGTTVYCAVPRTLERGVGLERRLADTVPDDLYSVDISTGARKLIARPDSNSTMKDLILSSDGKNLTFVESGSNLLRQIRLAP